MKRKPYGAMIAITVLAIIALFIVLLNLLGMIGRHGDFDKSYASVNCENAPEGTVYLDILAKLPTDSPAYLKFRAPEPPIEGAKISEDSEIAQYNEDGYVSLSLHYANFSAFSFHGDLESIRNTANGNFSELRSRYGGFKAAYVDKNGKVLSVTHKARTAYDPTHGNLFSANGDLLTFRVYEVSPIVFPLALLSALLHIALITLIVLYTRQRVTYGKPKHDNSTK